MNVEVSLYESAKKLALTRYQSGWAGAAAVRVKSGKILTSVSPDIEHEALGLCMEVGAYLEANKINEPVTHSLCVSRENENSEFQVLTPCGICQERLSYWGGDVLVAVTNPANELVFKTLRELQPFHWSAAYGKKL